MYIKNEKRVLLKYLVNINILFWKKNAWKL